MKRHLIRYQALSNIQYILCTLAWVQITSNRLCLDSSALYNLFYLTNVLAFQQNNLHFVAYHSFFRCQIISIFYKKEYMMKTEVSHLHFVNVSFIFWFMGKVVIHTPSAISHPLFLIKQLLLLMKNPNKKQNVNWTIQIQLTSIEYFLSTFHFGHQINEIFK